MSDHLVDPVTFGRLQAEVEALRRDSDRLVKLIEAQAASLAAIERQLSEARGGWKTLVLLGGAASAFGAALTKLLSFWSGS